MSLKFGLFWGLRAPPEYGRPAVENYANIAHVAEYAEELGYDSCFFIEHHFSEDSECPSPVVVAAAAAARTERILLGTGVLLLPLYEPVKLAEDVAVVDNISRGRFVLGVGMGYRQYEYDGLGVPMSHRPSRFEEAVELLRRCWTEESVTFEGRRFRTIGARVMPRPVQQPHPPIWVGATSRPAVLRAARLGLPLLIGPVAFPLAKRARELWKEQMQASGHSLDSLPMPLMRYGYIAESDERAWEEAGPYIVAHFKKAYLPYGGLWAQDPQTGRWGAVYDPDHPVFQNEGRGLIPERLLLGSPDTVIKEIERFQRETEFDHLMVSLEWGGMDPAKTRKAMELFAREVMPHFKRR